jgi:hypothetical protein
MDSYPTGLGQEIKDLLNGAKIVNGYGLNMDSPEYFNGMACLGAWLIGKLKLEGYGGERRETIGSVYLTNSKDRQEYNYFLSSKASLKSGGLSYNTLFLKVTNESGTELYFGPLEHFNASKVERAA